MIIRDIYQNLNISDNLQKHMLRVFSIVCWLEQNWVENEINWYQVKEMALLHDVGNIVKFDLQKHPELLGKEKKHIKYWQKIQQETIKKYGSDDDDATKKMLEELKIDDKIIETIYQKRFSNSVFTWKSDNWPLKILYYADLRTLPFSIGTLEERLNDVRNRMPKYTNRPDFENLICACQKIEIQIQQKVKISLSKINNTSCKKFSFNCLDFEI